jgi:hypothetical protein
VFHLYRIGIAWMVITICVLGGQRVALKTERQCPRLTTALRRRYGSLSTRLRQSPLLPINIDAAIDS